MSCFWRHKWSKWEQYQWRGTATQLWGKGAGNRIETAERRQRRKCELCGKEEDELVRDG